LTLELLRQQRNWYNNKIKKLNKMKKQMIMEPSKKVPTANVAVNKSRIKVYNKQGEMPTYYLQSGQEFQIEIFNPTTDVVLAKITLNNKALSQGGLVLNPGQRVFLDRYLDVAKKFLFDTYEVANTEEVKAAIENNGDIKVEFFKERIPQYFGGTLTLQGSSTSIGGSFGNPTWITNTGGYVQNINGSTNTTGNASFTSTSAGIGNTALYSSSVTMDSFNSSDVTYSQRTEPIKKSKLRTLSSMVRSKSIETGRVEQGSSSDQTFRTVNKDFEYFAFHTVEYKLLPVSQKINTVEDLNVKVYCTNCGTKLGKGHKFCSSCGTKA
jgi:hypothetical protein